MLDMDINPNKHSLTNHKASNNLSSKILALNHCVGTVVRLIRKDTVPLKVRNVISATNYPILLLASGKHYSHLQVIYLLCGALTICGSVDLLESGEGMQS